MIQFYLMLLKYVNEYHLSYCLKLSQVCPTLEKHSYKLLLKEQTIGLEVFMADWTCIESCFLKLCQTTLKGLLKRHKSANRRDNSNKIFKAGEQMVEIKDLADCQKQTWNC